LIWPGQRARPARSSGTSRVRVDSILRAGREPSPCHPDDFNGCTASRNDDVRVLSDTPPSLVDGIFVIGIKTTAIFLSLDVIEAGRNCLRGSLKGALLPACPVDQAPCSTRLMTQKPRTHEAADRELQVPAVRADVDVIASPLNGLRRGVANVPICALATDPLPLSRIGELPLMRKPHLMYALLEAPQGVSDSFGSACTFCPR
jgi:hypothetical protein